MVCESAQAHSSKLVRKNGVAMPYMPVIVKKTISHNILHLAAHLYISMMIFCLT